MPIDLALELCAGLLCSFLQSRHNVSIATDTFMNGILEYFTLSCFVPFHCRAVGSDLWLPDHAAKCVWDSPTDPCGWDLFALTHFRNDKRVRIVSFERPLFDTGFDRIKQPEKLYLDIVLQQGMCQSRSKHRTSGITENEDFLRRVVLVRVGN